MPRRASSGISIGQIIGLAAGILFILVVAFVLFTLLTGDGSLVGKKSNDGGTPRASANTELDVTAYLNNANSLRGGTYRLRGKIQEQLQWTADRGRLFAVEAQHSAATEPVPVLVPQEFSHLNIEKGTEFSLVVEVIDGGLLIARDIKQS